MPLRADVKAIPETPSDLLLAADDRYQEVEELLLQERFDGCVNLLGYSAEMWLKAACFASTGSWSDGARDGRIERVEDAYESDGPGSRF